MGLRVSLLDHGAGNLHSLTKALARYGATVDVVTRPEELVDARALVLPGVGAFGAAARRLTPYRDALVADLEAGKPALGICLGLQLLFDGSEESPGAEGLGFVQGTVRRLAHRKLPHIGWNEIETTQDPLFDGLDEGIHVYYVNSYAPAPDEDVAIATTTYGEAFTAAVRKRNSYGLQFHPEKSSRAGLRMIENWVQLAEEHA